MMNLKTMTMLILCLASCAEISSKDSRTSQQETLRLNSHSTADTNAAGTTQDCECNSNSGEYPVPREPENNGEGRCSQTDCTIGTPGLCNQSGSFDGLVQTKSWDCDQNGELSLGVPQTSPTGEACWVDGDCGKGKFCFNAKLGTCSDGSACRRDEDCNIAKGVCIGSSMGQCS